MRIALPRRAREAARTAHEQQILTQARRQIFGDPGRPGTGLDLTTHTGRAAAVPILAGAVSCLRAVKSDIVGGAR